MSVQSAAPQAAGTTAAGNRPQNKRPRLPAGLKDAGRMLVILAALVFAFAALTDNFLSTRTFSAITAQVPALMVAGVGMTLVLIIGQIDLSVGSVLAFAGATMGVVMVKTGGNLWLGMLVALFTGAALGAINGLVMARFRLPSFIVTLGMLEMARGATYIVSDSRTVYIGAPIEVLADARIAGLSLPFVLALAAVVGGQILLSKTVFGRHLIATGTNEEAVRLCGLNEKRIKVLAFVLSGALAGVAAIMHSARLAAADPNAGAGFELQAIAAVVIGGTSLMGGRGSVLGTLFGVFVISVLDAGLAQIGAQEPVKRLITGIVIVVAVIIDNLRHGRKS